MPISDKPLLEHHLKMFREFGIKDLILNVHYMPEKITGYFGDGSNAYTNTDPDNTVFTIPPSSVRTIGSWPMRSAKVVGRYLRASTR